MQLPIDLNKLSNAITDMNEARDSEVSVSVYIEDGAPADLVAHVRNAFASTSAHVRMTVTYLDDSFYPHKGDDIAIVVADTAQRVGAAAAAIRAVGVPAMVVTLSPQILADVAYDAGRDIPADDIVSPAYELGAMEPLELTDEAAAQLDERMGNWIVSVCREKRLALSIAFPFMRRAMACDSVQLTALQNAGIGLVPFIPGADLPLMTLNQAKMVMQIAAAYGHEMDKGRWKELLAVVGGAYLSRILARELIEFVPALGFLIRTGVAYGCTSALGYAVIEYYEGGEDATGVANVVSKAGETGMRAVARASEIAADPSTINFDRAKDVIDTAREKVDEYAPKAIELVGEYAPQAISKAKEVAPQLAGMLKGAVGKAAPAAQAN